MGLPVWLYWEGECPQWINECRQTVFAHADNIRLIGPEQFDKLRDSDRDIELGTLCTAHRADFIRAFLLARYGGFWIDSDCIVMRSLSPLFAEVNAYDFIGYRERGGYVANNFMGAPPQSKIASAYYQRVCSILRSGSELQWLTLGSDALTATIEKENVSWYEMDVDMIQPVCWSRPELFFAIKDDATHEQLLNHSSYCYMLSANMVGGYMQTNPSRTLLQENTFFRFLIQRSGDEKITSKLMKIAYRQNTDDDIWVIPELINKDMYRIKNVLSKLEPGYPTYVIDCGAHIGAFAIMCSTYLKHASVISFEPNPDSFYYLEKNAATFSNIRPLQKAVDIKDGTLDLYSPAQADWSGRWSCTPNGNASITVESINLFSFIKKLDKPVFILKLDLEGYEELIINNATEDDLSTIKIIVVETHTDSFNHDKLKSFGFELMFNPDISSSRQFVYCRKS
jgi:FkbM family methyltransferase